MKKKTIVASGIDKAILLLAEHIERCPYNEYKVIDKVLEALGYERISPKKNKKEIKES